MTPIGQLFMNLTNKIAENSMNWQKITWYSNHMESITPLTAPIALSCWVDIIGYLNHENVPPDGEEIKDLANKI